MKLLFNNSNLSGYDREGLKLLQGQKPSTSLTDLLYRDCTFNNADSTVV